MGMQIKRGWGQSGTVFMPCPIGPPKLHSGDPKNSHSSVKSAFSFTSPGLPFPLCSQIQIFQSPQIHVILSQEWRRPESFIGLNL